MALPPLLFELAALPYAWMTAHPDWAAHCAALAAHFPPGAGRTILDLGCGPGVSTRALAAACPGDRVVGLDLVAAMLRRASRGDPTRRWVRGDVHALPFASGVADAVAGHSLLYLLADRRRALGEIARVLRPGGRLVLLEPSDQGAADAARSVGASLVRSGPKLALTMACWRVAARTSGAFTEGGLARALAAAGLVRVEIRPTLHGLGLVAVAEKP